MALAAEQEQPKLPASFRESVSISLSDVIVPQPKEIATQTSPSTKNVSLQFRSKGSVKTIGFSINVFNVVFHVCHN